MDQLQKIEEKVKDLCSRHKADRLFVLTDTNVAPMVGNIFLDSPRLVVDAGEESKSLEGASKIWRFLSEEGALRRSVLVNIGGGMISDLGGFAAATFKRGIKAVNLPTTLLGAVDAAIGGKTGIDFNGLKNEIGAFALPLAVFPITSLFNKLPEEEWLSGVGEAIKTGLLHSEYLFRLATSEAFIKNRDPETVDEVVNLCAEFKERIVTEDFRETGRRKILNLGHTAGHAIESWKLAHGTPVPHGIAVAHGLLFALMKSREEAGLEPQTVETYEEILHRYFPPLDMSDTDLEEAWQFMAHDKKNVVKGEPSWVLLRAIGKPVI